MSTALLQTQEDKLFSHDKWEVLKKLWPYIRPQKLSFIIASFLILMTTAIEVISPMVVGLCVDAAVKGGDPHRTLALAIAFLSLVVGRSILDTVQAYLLQSAGQKVVHRLRCELFSHILHLPISYFDRNPTGRLLTRVVNDIKSVSELFTASLSVLVLDVMIIMGTIVAMLFINFYLAVGVLFSFPFVVYTIHHFGKLLAAAYRKVRKELAELNAFLGENIAGIATIQRLAAEKERLASFDEIGERHLVAQLESLRVFAVVQPLSNVANGVSMAVLIIGGGYAVIHGQLTLGIVVAFLGYIRNLFQPVRDLVEKYNIFLSATVSAERVVGILEEPKEGAGSPPSTSNQFIDAHTLSLKCENVSFQYPTRDELAINNLSFDLPAGKKLALIGRTGSGKSTLLKLVLRFYEPRTGNILLGAPRSKLGI